MNLGESVRVNSLLKPEQIEDSRVRAYMALRGDIERMEHYLKSNPAFVDEAIDRLTFYDRRISGREGKVFEIGRDRFGDGFDDAVFRGYVRIFAEFLGHFSACKDDLILRKYKTKIVHKIKSGR